jgi:hypothetical protein
MTGHPVIAVINLIQLGRFFATKIVYMQTACVELASDRRVQGTGDFT